MFKNRRNNNTNYNRQQRLENHQQNCNKTEKPSKTKIAWKNSKNQASLEKIEHSKTNN